MPGKYGGSLIQSSQVFQSSLLNFKTSPYLGTTNCIYQEIETDEEYDFDFCEEVVTSSHEFLEFKGNAKTGSILTATTAEIELPVITPGSVDREIERKRLALEIVEVI